MIQYFFPNNTNKYLEKVCIQVALDNIHRQVFFLEHKFQIIGKFKDKQKSHRS